MKKLEFIENGELRDFDKIVIFIHGWKGNKSSFQTVSSLIKIPNTKSAPDKARFLAFGSQHERERIRRDHQP